MKNSASLVHPVFIPELFSALLHLLDLLSIHIRQLHGALAANDLVEPSLIRHFHPNRQHGLDVDERCRAFTVPPAHGFRLVRLHFVPKRIIDVGS